MQTIRSVLFWSFENIPSGKVLQKDDKKKVGIFFLVQNYVFTSEWKFLWGWFNFRERERESEKKPLRLFCFTQDLVYDFSQATLIISVGFCNFFGIHT